jgi:hypothetical protein
MTWWTVICWPITPFLLKCCPNFHQHHRNSHQPPLVVLCFLPITQPPPTSHSLSLSLSIPSPASRQNRLSQCPVCRAHSGRGPAPPRAQSTALLSRAQSAVATAAPARRPAPSPPSRPHLSSLPWQAALSKCMNRNRGRPTAGGSPRLTPKSKVSGRPTCPTRLSA